MKMQYPPLESATFEFSFPPIKGLSIILLSDLINSLNHYPKPPNILLLQSLPKTGITFQTLQVTPLTFTAENSTLQLFSDRVVFRFTKYTSWTETRKIIMDSWKTLCEQLNIKEYEDLVIRYFDIFEKFSREKFKLSKYFKLNPNYPSMWQINYQDFHLGVNLMVEGGVFIIKLRGVPSDQEENYQIYLQSYYRSDKELFSAQDFDIVQNRLDDAHRIIVDHFYEILTNTTKIILGVYEDGSTD